MTRYPPLEDLLPHRAPMILLDRVEDDAAESITCGVTLRDESTFVENGSVPAVVATEYMAQCVATFAGLKASRQGGEVRVGYVIGARLIEFAVDAFHVGENLVVEAHRVWGDDILGTFECTVSCGGRRMASAILTVYQGDIDSAAIGQVPKR